ncbi:fluoride efflux transporter CrcB [Sphingomonas sp. H39-1-10]|uniref:fluoride efflux transporter CrcB n=1 Tax=Sphingomonas pollutisoli TaxID=3030829 RepID=UPI0023BA035C|nr:fluoride efflux transporter CrcB [Sphingomonas pollutisoli]MDF0490539.1 fluoride efflux transporter CrcB [Sphingomonas pollutisoli]
MMTYIWIAAGGLIGTLLRYQINLFFTARLGEAMPWGTIIINITGSFIIGLFAALTETGGRWAVPPEIRAFILVGLCGGYTTFSSFSLQTLALIQSGEIARALGNVVTSVVAGLLAVWIGATAPLWLARLFRS